MDIGNQIAKELIAETTNIIGLYPGKFKPPHKGHFYVVENAAKICDEVHIIISNGMHAGYDDYSSKKVWETYLKYLPNNVKIKIAESSSPVTEVYKEIKNKDNSYLVIYGKGDEGRFKAINENREKYWNTQVVDAGNKDNLSSTQLRECIKNRNIEGIKQLIPEQVSVNKFLFNFQLHEIKIHHPDLFQKGKSYNIPTIMGHTTVVGVYRGQNNFGTAYIFDTPNGNIVIGKKSEEVTSIKPINEIKINRPGDITFSSSGWENDTSYFIGKDDFHSLEQAISWSKEKLRQQYNWRRGNYSFLIKKHIKGNDESIKVQDIKLSDIGINEIKINPPGLNFPIKITNQNQAQEVGKELIKLGYMWLDGSKIDITNAPFKTGYFEEFSISQISPKKIIVRNESINEVFNDKDHKSTLDKAIDYVCIDLGVERPEIELINDPEYTNQHSSFGGYVPGEKKIYAVVYNRNMADIMRSIAHELKHYHQDLEGRLVVGAGKDGDEFENEANSYSGKIMREIGRNIPEIFENEDKYQSRLEAMAKRKDPEKLTSLGKEYLPEIKIQHPLKFVVQDSTDPLLIDEGYNQLIWNRKIIPGRLSMDQGFIIPLKFAKYQENIDLFIEKFDNLFFYKNQNITSIDIKYIIDNTTI